MTGVDPRTLKAGQRVLFVGLRDATPAEAAERLRQIPLDEQLAQLGR